MKQEMELILTFLSHSYFPVDGFKLWNLISSLTITRDIEIIGFLVKTGNRIIETGNGIILTFWSDGQFPVDDFRL